MSTGITCRGKESYGLTGKNCEGIAPPETGVCTGCSREASAVGKTIQVLTAVKTITRNWPGKELEAS